MIIIIMICIYVVHLLNYMSILVARFNFVLYNIVLDAMRRLGRLYFAVTEKMYTFSSYVIKRNLEKRICGR